MELKHVQPGEKITADGYNSVVDAASGNRNFSTVGFKNIGGGSLFTDRSTLKTRYFDGAWRTMFQVVKAKYWKQTSRGTWDFSEDPVNTLLIDLGPNAATLKQNISIRGQNVENAAIVVGDDAGMDCEITDDIYKNASDHNTDWVDLGVEADFIAGDVMLYTPDDQNGEVKYYFVVTDRTETDVISRAKEIFDIDDGELTILKRFYLTKGGSSQYSSVSALVQAHTGAISWSDPISSEVLSGDSQILSSLLSSIQVVDISAEISSEIEISGEISTVTETVKNKGIQWYNFQEDNTALSDIEVLSASVPIRRIPDGSQEVSANYYVDYVALSDILVSCDADGEHIISSASITNKDHELRIYGFVEHDKNFEETKRAQYLNRDLKHNANIADIQLRVLSGGDSGEAHETEFISLYDVMEKHPDTSIEDAMSSLEYVELSTDSMSVDYMQLYKFNKKDYVILSSELPEKKNHLDIVVRDWTATDDKSKAQVSYLPLSCLSSANVSVDTTFPGSNTSSIVIAADDQGETYLMLKGFKDEEPQEISNVLNIGSEYDFLLRHNDDEHKELRYANLSALLSAALSSLSVDSEVSALQRYSIEKVGDNNDILQLYNFASVDVAPLSIILGNETKMSDKAYQFLVRSNDDTTGSIKLEYAQLCVDAIMSVDTECAGSHTSSIVIENCDDGECLALKGFNGESPLSFTAVSAKSSEYDVLLRHASDSTYELKYMNISALLSGISGELSINISGDTQIGECSTSSIVTLSTDSGTAIQIKGFDGQAALATETVSADVASYDVLLRHKGDDDKYDMQYVNVSALLSGSATSADTLRQPRYNWMWPTETISGVTQYIEPGRGTMYGYYQYSYSMQYFSGTIPAQTDTSKSILCISGQYSTTGAGYPSNVQLVWTNSYPSRNLSSWGVPLYSRYNSPDNGPTYDYRAGYFVVPTYY